MSLCSAVPEVQVSSDIRGVGKQLQDCAGPTSRCFQGSPSNASLNPKPLNPKP